MLYQQRYHRFRAAVPTGTAALGKSAFRVFQMRDTTSDREDIGLGSTDFQADLCHLFQQVNRHPVGGV